MDAALGLRVNYLSASVGPCCAGCAGRAVATNLLPRLAGVLCVGSLALALVVPAVIELTKIPRRRALARPETIDPAHAVCPDRARAAKPDQTRATVASGTTSA